MVTRVRELRDARGWTQADLAHAAGCRVATISKLETDPEHTNLETVLKAAAGFGLPPGDLFDQPDGLPSLGALVKVFLRLPPADRDAFIRQMEAMADRAEQQAG